MILNCFNVINFIEKEIGGFDNSMYIVKHSINQVVLSINSCFDWESLSDEIQKAFPQTDFTFIVICGDLLINW